MAIKEKTETKQVETKTVSKKTRKLDDKSIVTVISNFSGLLFYRSPRTQDEWEWAEYGDEHEMSIQELKSMKAQHRKFFEDKWIIFPDKDSDAISHLKIEKYYKDVVTPVDMEDIFEITVEELTEIIDRSTANEKALLLTKAREKFESGELVNTHIIKLIEDKLQVDIDINPK